MIRFLLSVVIIAVVIGPFLGGHAFGHSGVKADGHASHSHSPSAQQKFERSYDGENTRSCCHDALMHCATFGIGLSTQIVSAHLGTMKAWTFPAGEVTGGLLAEVEAPPPRI
jgi:hypothetical protein